MKKKVTICLSYYNQKSALREIVLGWKSYPEKVKEAFSFSIVDDYSLTGTALSTIGDIDLSDLDLHIYRVEQDLYCNIAGARNLAVQECKTEWIVILDVDTIITNETSEQILSLASVPRECPLAKDGYKFSRKNIEGKTVQPHPATCLIRKEDYWKAGGCNEDLVGDYGGTDNFFWAGWRAAELNVTTLRNVYVETGPRGTAPGINREKWRPRKHPSLPSPPQHVRFIWKKLYPK